TGGTSRENCCPCVTRSIRTARLIAKVGRSRACDRAGPVDALSPAVERRFRATTATAERRCAPPPSHAHGAHDERRGLRWPRERMQASSAGRTEDRATPQPPLRICEAAAARLQKLSAPRAGSTSRQRPRRADTTPLHPRSIRLARTNVPAQTLHGR